MLAIGDAMNIRLPIDELRTGMYVAELDRSWLETDFLFQGFTIESQGDIDRLRRCCKYVYINADRSADAQAVTAAAHGIAGKPTTAPRPRGGLVAQVLRPLPGSTPFVQEVERAKDLRRQAKAHIFHMLEDARLGHSVDTAGAKRLVTGMVGSIMRNADALIWMTQLKNRDEYTAMHSFNVCVLTLSFGRHLEMDQNTLVEAGLGALMHDIGKIRVPLEILNKPGKLTDREFAEMKNHPAYGRKILLESKDVYPSTIDIAYSHHERMQGQGYPRGLKDEAIGMLARMVAIVDMYDAITSDRIYHKGRSAIDTLKMLYEWRSSSLDKRLVEEFIQCLGIYPVGTLVELSNLEVGVVVSTNRNLRLKPQVLVVMDEKKRPHRPHRLLDLAHAGESHQGGDMRIRRVLQPDEYGVRLKELIEETRR